MSPESATPLSIERMMKEALSEPGMLSLAVGFTDNRIMPRQEIASLVDEILASASAGGEALQYGAPQGRPGLRRRVAERVGELDRGVGGDPGVLDRDDVLITNGSQQGLDLAVRALCAPGDIVLVEAPTYFVFLEVLRELGVEAVALPSDGDRLDVDRLPGFLEALKRDGRAERVRLAYLMGYFANPTGYSLARETKIGFVETLRGFDLDVPVLEDAAYREFHFDQPWPVPSSLALGRGRLPVIYAGTFTKSFATGLKVGYLLIPDGELRDRIGTLKRIADFGTGNFVQAVVERALARGVYDRFLERMRPLYAEKARRLHEALEREGLRELGWSWTEPRGGLYLWLTAPEDVGVGPASEFYQACLEEKVMYVPGPLCYAGGTDGKIRLSFGNVERERLEEAATRLVRAARSVGRAEQRA